MRVQFCLNMPNQLPTRDQLVLHEMWCLSRFYDHPVKVIRYGQVTREGVGEGYNLLIPVPPLHQSDPGAMEGDQLLPVYSLATDGTISFAAELFF